MNAPSVRYPDEVPLDRREFMQGAAFGVATAALRGLRGSRFTSGQDARGPGHVRWGVWPDARGGHDIAHVRDTLETEIGRKFAVDRKRGSGVGLDVPLITDYVESSAAQGRMPYVKVHSWTGSPDTGGRIPVPWADVAAGRWDNRIGALAREASGFRKPMYFAFHAEPNIQSPEQPHIGGPADFRAAWEHVRSLFDLAGTPNVRWVVVLTAGVYRGEFGGAEAWLPARFDLIGVDGYNRGHCASQGWRSFEQIFRSARARAMSVGKPLFIGECGSV